MKNHVLIFVGMAALILCLLLVAAPTQQSVGTVPMADRESNGGGKPIIEGSLR